MEPDFVNNYDELIKIAMDDEIKNIKLTQEEGVFNLEETKRRDLLNYIKKSSKCNFIDRNILRNCKSNQEQTAAVDQWLKDYDEYEKEQEVN